MEAANELGAEQQRSPGIDRDVAIEVFGRRLEQPTLAGVCVGVDKSGQRADGSLGGVENARGSRRIGQIVLVERAADADVA